MNKLLKRRIDKLEAYADLRDLVGTTDAEVLAKAASLLCGISLSQLRDLQAEQTDPRRHCALSNQQQFALAIVSAENEAFNALLNVYNDSTFREANSIEEVYGKAYEEWQRMRAAQLAGGYSIGRRAPGWLEE